ncbi:MAG TPA: NIPSNAP family protein [Luteitalea sp.]|nr:NIPSNAP family protein [Luteitalea sp.]
MRLIRSSVVLAVVFVAGLVVGQFSRADLAAQPAPGQQVYELRTYYTHPGKLVDLNKRFRDHTTRIFEKHGMTNIGYWVPQDEPAHSNTLIYVIAHASREQAKKNWDAFRVDPEWQKVKTESEAAGPIVTKVDSVYMDAVDYSKLK